MSRLPRIALRDLASDTALERHTIERAVREATGLSFRAYQRERLLTAALSLLADRPRRSIKEIAIAIGYRAPEAFSRFVRRATGSTPGEIRRSPVFNGGEI
ncbi:MAG: AraC family transcriptional regulator [Acidobacteria bacterium]|nr:AraC family transcriptional regulator [Acidobacteriota bacterium]